MSCTNRPNRQTTRSEGSRRKEHLLNCPPQGRNRAEHSRTFAISEFGFARGFDRPRRSIPASGKAAAAEGAILIWRSESCENNCAVRTSFLQARYFGDVTLQKKSRLHRRAEAGDRGSSRGRSNGMDPSTEGYPHQPDAADENRGRPNLRAP